MKISKELFQYISQIKGSVYEMIKLYFLFHSNKLEGSTFSYEELIKLVDNNKVSGEHDIDDVYETMNSLKVFDYIIGTLGEPLTHKFLQNVNSMLEKDTRNDKLGLIGAYKTVPNRIAGSHIEVSLPKDVYKGMDDLLSWWDNCDKSVQNIAIFHSRFEHIHPFQDGNGRTGRFVILKQCVENDQDLIFIDSNNSDTYKAWLETSQTIGNYDYLIELFITSQKDLDKEFEKSGIAKLLTETKKCVNS